MELLDGDELIHRANNNTLTKQCLFDIIKQTNDQLTLKYIMRYACHNYNIRLAKYCLELGFDINSFVFCDLTGLLYTTMMFYPRNNKRIKFVKFLLKHGAKLDVKDSYNNTPLSLAKENNYYSVIKLFYKQNK